MSVGGRRGRGEDIHKTSVKISKKAEARRIALLQPQARVVEHLTIHPLDPHWSILSTSMNKAGRHSSDIQIRMSHLPRILSSKYGQTIKSQHIKTILIGHIHPNTPHHQIFNFLTLLNSPK